MNASSPARVRTARREAGFSYAEIWGAAEVRGEQRLTFLDAQLTQAVAALAPGEGAASAYLDRKGRVTHLLAVAVMDDAVLLLAPREDLAGLLEKLERYHIREPVTFRSLEERVAVVELHGPRTPEVLAAAAGRPVPLTPRYRHEEILVDGVAIRVVADGWTGDPGARLVVPREHLSRLRDALRAGEGGPELAELSAEDLEVMRIEGGVPRVGVDTTEKTLVLELPSEDLVNHNKGCYLGQETVARVHSRGRVNRHLRGLRVEGEAVPPPGSLILAGDSPVGETLSATHSPSLDTIIALAMVRREAAEPSTVVHVSVGDRHPAATVVDVPLYRAPGPAEEARRLYREGIEAFKSDGYPQALALFQRATLMDPTFYDAYESAGVCLERMGLGAEAAEVMEQLVELDPENIMAWTNLSRYAAERGDIAKAEEIKGKVTYLVWKKQAGEVAAKKRSREEAEARRQRLTERVDLFRQVLELDPDDVVALFGLGKVLLDLGRPAEAVSPLRRAIEQKPDYSMAYNHLGTALAELGQDDDAAEVFRRGIAAATAKGDFIPKRDMTRKLSDLEAGSSGPSD